MTKQNIEKAIRNYLNDHLDFFPIAVREELQDKRVEKIFLAEDAYTGKAWYNFTGEGTGWIKTEDGGKSSRLFKIQPSTILISGDNEPIIEGVANPLLIYQV